MKSMIDWTWGDINLGEVGPGPYSKFHLIWFFGMIAVCIILGLTVARRHSNRADRIFISVCAVILAACEIFKQLFWYEFYGYYRFEIFPYQFCSVPIYAACIAAIVPWDKVRELCYRFLAFYGTVGGIAVMLIPHAVLYTYFVPMSIHAMLWHAVLVIMGVYLIISRGYGKRIFEMRAPAIIFLFLVGAAIVGNILVYKLYLGTPACQPGDRLSMFYISPYYETELPLLDAVQRISYPLFVLCYILLFNSFALTVWGTAHLIRRLRREKF